MRAVAIDKPNNVFQTPPSNSPDLIERQETPSSPTYFETTWERFESPYNLGVEISFNYTISSTEQSVAESGFLSLLMLWTSATIGTPDSSNTYLVGNLTYACEAAPDDESCSYDLGKSGEANLALKANPEVGFPQAESPLRNFFLCLANETDPTSSVNSPICRSYSGFFDVNTTSAQIKARHDPTLIKNRQAALNHPIRILTVTLESVFLLSTSISNTMITTYLQLTYTTTNFAPTPTTAPKSTSTAPESTSIASPKPPKFPSGAIAGIILGVALLICAIIATLIFFRRRKARKGSTSEGEKPYPDAAELPRGGHHETTELGVKYQGIMQPKAELSGEDRKLKSAIVQDDAICELPAERQVNEAG